MLTEYELKKLSDYLVYQSTFEILEFTEDDLAEISDGIAKTLCFLEDGLAVLGYQIEKIKILKKNS